MSEFDLLIVALVSLVGSFVKSVTGLGYPLIGVPILTLLFGIEAAIVVIAIPNAFLNAWLCFDARGQFGETRDLPILLGAALVGGAIGTMVLVGAPEEPLLIFLAATVLVFVVQRTRQPELALAPTTTRRWAPLVGLAAGICHGAVGVSGPIVAAWFAGYRLPKNAYVLCVASLFLAGGLAQLAVLLAAGRFGPDRWLATGVAFGATVAVIPIGRRVRERISAETFERLVLVLLVGSGLSLLWRALA